MAFSAAAQDAHFTQFYAAPIYLNPAFAGTSVQSRFTMNYRNQWPAIPKAFVTYGISYDQYMPDIKSGIGFMLMHDKAGTGGLSRTHIAVAYSNEIKINRKTSFRPSIQASYNFGNVNVGRLVFGDQLIRDNAPTSVEQIFADPKGYLDFAGGLLLYAKKYWVGISGHHLNRPNESFLGEISQLPIKYSIHGGHRFRIKGTGYRRSRNELVAAFNYRGQAQFDQLDIGAYYEATPLTIGIWYRNLPLKSNTFNYANHDSFSLLVGMKYNGYKVAYSYDFTVSQLSIGASAGSHELSMSYEWANKKNKRLAKRRIVPCAKF